MSSRIFASSIERAAWILLAAMGAALGAPGLAPGAIAASQSLTINLDLAAIILALGTAAAGFAAFRRLRTERPKIVEEVAALHEGRLRDALDAAWAEADRLRAIAASYRAELDEQVRRCDALERRERELEDLVATLQARIG